MGFLFGGGFSTVLQSFDWATISWIQGQCYSLGNRECGLTRHIDTLGIMICVFAENERLLREVTQE